ncbi:MAG: hypothetical protein K2N51_05250 [Lachnospiraceae bacterium]|nr:hypothetical protein [Lachnospiraceae bacterium]
MLQTLLWVWKSTGEKRGFANVCDMNRGSLNNKYKVGASVVALRRGGALSAVDVMNHFFMNQEMIIVGSIYWNMVYGQMPGVC